MCRNIAASGALAVQQRPEFVRLFSQRREVHAGDDRLVARVAGEFRDNLLVGFRVDHVRRAAFKRLLVQAHRLCGFAEAAVYFGEEMGVDESLRFQGVQFVELLARARDIATERIGDAQP